MSHLSLLGSLYTCPEMGGAFYFVEVEVDIVDVEFPRVQLVDVDVVEIEMPRVPPCG